MKWHPWNSDNGELNVSTNCDHSPFVFNLKAGEMIQQIPNKKEIKKRLLSLVDEIADSDLRFLEMQVEYHEGVPLEENGVVVHTHSDAKTLKISWTPRKQE